MALVIVGQFAHIHKTPGAALQDAGENLFPVSGKSQAQGQVVAGAHGNKAEKDLFRVMDPVDGFVEASVSAYDHQADFFVCLCYVRNDVPDGSVRRGIIYLPGMAAFLKAGFYVLPVLQALAGAGGGIDDDVIMQDCSLLTDGVMQSLISV
jgi:hypothetical protein